MQYLPNYCTIWHLDKCKCYNRTFAANDHKVQNNTKGKQRPGTSKTKRLQPVLLDFPLFWTFQSKACPSAWWILYHVSVSCKEPTVREHFPFFGCWKLLSKSNNLLKKLNAILLVNFKNISKNLKKFKDFLRTLQIQGLFKTTAKIDSEALCKTIWTTL